MDSSFRAAILLQIGGFALWLPIFALERRTMNARTFWKDFSHGMPNWIIPTLKLFAVFFAIHGILFLIQSHAASPEIKNGQYVLDSHGRTVKFITQQQYLSLKGLELRSFAAGWMCFYSVPAAYWWFHRNRERLRATPLGTTA